MSLTWKQQFEAAAELDGEEWETAVEQLEQEWLDAYAAAFVEIAIARGWRRDDAVPGAAEIGTEAFIESGRYDRDPRRTVEADVIACEELL